MDASLFASSLQAGANSPTSVGQEQSGHTANGADLPPPYLLAAAAASQHAAAALHLSLPHHHTQLPGSPGGFNAAAAFPFLSSHFSVYHVSGSRVVINALLHFPSNFNVT